jgi:hypothetical protein
MPVPTDFPGEELRALTAECDVDHQLRQGEATRLEEGQPLRQRRSNKAKHPPIAMTTTALRVNQRQDSGRDTSRHRRTEDDIDPVSPIGCRVLALAALFAESLLQIPGQPLCRPPPATHWVKTTTRVAIPSENRAVVPATQRSHYPNASCLRDYSK